MSTSFFKHTNYNFQRSRSMEKSTPPFKSQRLLSGAIWFGIQTSYIISTAFIRVFFCTILRINGDYFYTQYSLILFMMEGCVYRAVQTESLNMTKLNLVFKLPEFCHNVDLQPRNLNRMLNFLVCCMSPAVHFLLPYFLHFL
jgi:hypothetical protein